MLLSRGLHPEDELSGSEERGTVLLAVRQVGRDSLPGDIPAGQPGILTVTHVHVYIIRTAFLKMMITLNATSYFYDISF